MSKGNTEPHVLIIGAGPCGLMLAQGLKKRGVKFSIFESDLTAAGRPGGDWGMGLYWSRPLLAQILPDDMFARIQDATGDPTLDPKDNATIPVLHGETGELLHEIQLDWLCRVSRKKVRVLFSEGLDIQFNKRLEKVSWEEDGDTVTAIFKDGTEATGTMIVGCDGARSIVRHSVLPPDLADAKNAPLVGVRTLFKLPTHEQAKLARSINPIAFMSIHPAGIWGMLMVLDVPDNDNLEKSTFQFITTWAKPLAKDEDGKEVRSADVTVDELREKSTKFGGVFGQLNEWVFKQPEEEVVRAQIRIGSWPTKPWDTHGGRILFAGDAAHCMPFHRGQGLNHCVVDVLNMSEAMARVANEGADLQQEMDAYVQEVVKRGNREVNLSLENSAAVHDWERYKESAVIKEGVMSQGSESTDPSDVIAQLDSLTLH